MKCPYCEKEMEHGYIEGGSAEMNWKPHKTSAFKSGNVEFNEGAVLLSKFSIKNLLGKNCIEAYLCRTCNKIEIDVVELSNL